MLTCTIQPFVGTDVAEIVKKSTADVLDRMWLILIHNDDITPYDYVIRILERVFMLSEELADHVASTAHNEGVAVVLIRPRYEAEKLISVAYTAARADGYPLTFSMEPEE